MTINRHHPRTLNGWQRLWVLCSLIWAAIVIAYTLIAWPVTAPTLVEYAPKSAPGYEDLLPGHPNSQQHADGQAASASFDPDAYLAKKRLENLENNMATSFNSLQAEEQLKKTQRRPSFNFLEAEEDLKAKLRADELTSQRQWAVMRAAVCWLAIVLGTYVFGWGVAWVRRGFREVN